MLMIHKMLNEDISQYLMPDRPIKLELSLYQSSNHQQYLQMHKLYRSL